MRNVNLGVHDQQIRISGAYVEPRLAGGAHVESPPGSANNVSEGHREIGAACGVLARVLIEDSVVEDVPALVEPLVPLAKSGDPFLWGEGQRQSHRVNALSVRQKS